MNDFVQIPNKNHTEKDKERDLSGQFILISECFYYFGSKAIYIPNDVRPSIPKAQSAHGYRTWDILKAGKFIDYIQKKYEKGIIGMPHKWPK